MSLDNVARGFGSDGNEFFRSDEARIRNLVDVKHSEDPLVRTDLNEDVLPRSSLDTSGTITKISATGPAPDSTDSSRLHTQLVRPMTPDDRAERCLYVPFHKEPEIHKLTPGASSDILFDTQRDTDGDHPLDHTDSIATNLTGLTSLPTYSAILSSAPISESVSDSEATLEALEAGRRISHPRLDAAAIALIRTGAAVQITSARAA